MIHHIDCMPTDVSAEALGVSWNGESPEVLVDKLIDASSRGVEPGSEEGNKLALEHRASISQWYSVSANKQVILARMYVSDERFDATYKGKAAYLLQLVEALAQVEGVDLENVEWE